MTNDVKRVKDIIEHTKDIAFVVGNGVNRYNGACSWEELLKQLWLDFTGKSCPKDVFNGVSNTEFYDLIDLKILKEARLLDINQKKKLIHLATIPDSHKNWTIFDFMSKWERLRDEKLKEFSLSMNGVQPSDLSLINSIGTNTYRNLWQSDIQEKVVEYLRDWNPSSQHYMIGRKIASLRAPLLTTNYDENFNRALNCRFYRLGRTNFSKINPFSGYWGQHVISNPLDDFGIWHINGLIKYPNSIKLGLSQYMTSVEKVRALIHGKSSDVESFTGKNQGVRWRGYNTWLHAFFNKSLFIFGLALNKDEVFLRWLLFERIKYFTLFSKSFKGWYITTKRDYQNMSLGQKMFFQDVGIEVIPLDSYKQICNDIWE